MNKCSPGIVASLFFCLLPGCVDLPGSDSQAPVSYTLQGPERACDAAQRTLTLGVVQVPAGLDSDHIARVHSATGEVSYLAGLRWVDSAGFMLQQRLAADLECSGFAVQTGHRTYAGQSRLQCELRALNLRQDERGDEAEVALSCFYKGGGDEPELAILSSAQVPLDRWSGAAAVGALSAAYAEVFDDLLARLPAH